MNKCPNCSQPVTDQDAYCRTCGFNLAKYRRDYFTGEEPEAASNDSLQETQEMKQAAPQSSWLDDEEAKPAEPAEPTEPPKRELTGGPTSPKNGRKSPRARSTRRPSACSSGCGEHDHCLLRGVACWSSQLQPGDRLDGFCRFHDRPLVGLPEQGSQPTRRQELTDEFKQTTSKVFDSFDDRESELKEEAAFCQQASQGSVKVEQHKTSRRPKAQARLWLGPDRRGDGGHRLIPRPATASRPAAQPLTIASVFFETGNALMQSGQYVPAAIIYAVLAA